MLLADSREQRLETVIDRGQYRAYGRKKVVVKKIRSGRRRGFA
jgi:hypothetical protein